MNSKRYSGIVILALFLLLGLSNGIALAQTGVSVSPATQNVNQSDPFTINITVNPDTPILGVQFDLSFDSSLVEANGVIEGTLLKQDGASTFFQPGTIDNAAGTITGVAGAIIAEGAPVSSPDVFATISFTAKMVDVTSPLDLSNVIVGNSSGAVPSTANNGSVTVGEDECGTMDVSPTSWSPPIDCGQSDSQTVTVSASGGRVEGVTVSKVSGPAWLSVSPTNLGDLASGSSEIFRMTATTPTGTSSDFAYTIQVNNTCGTPKTAAVTGTIHVPGPNPRYDINEDGVVNYLDAAYIGIHYGEMTTEPYPRYDINKDGITNYLDAAYIGIHYGEMTTEPYPRYDINEDPTTTDVTGEITVYVERQTTVNVTPQAQTVPMGSPFTVNITVEPAECILGAQFDLSFDPSLVRADWVRAGDLVFKNGDVIPPIFFSPGTIDNAAGAITDVFVIVGGGAPVSSPGTFATISLTAKMVEGTSPLDLSNVIVGDSSGAVPIMVNDGVVIIITCMGDVNGDGVVNVLDMIIVGRCWNQRPNSGDPCYPADVNKDGVVNVLDVIQIGLHRGPCP